MESIKLRYCFDNGDGTLYIAYGELIGTSVVFPDDFNQDGRDVYEVHLGLFEDDNDETIYEYDLISIKREDSIKDHVSCVIKEFNGGAYIYHDALAQRTGNGYESATYWSNPETKNVTLHTRYEDIED